MKLSNFLFFFVLYIAPSVQFARSSKVLKVKGFLGDASLRSLKTNHFIPRSAPLLATTSAHWMPVTDVLSNLQSSEIDGLTTMQVEERLQTFGKNELTEPPKKSLMSLILEQFEDKLVQALLFIAFFSGFHAAFQNQGHDFVEPIVILAILFINAFIGVQQSRSAESSLEALKQLQPSICTVLRNGAWIGSFPTSQLVPGDMIYLKIGDKVPADARIVRIKGNVLSTDESCLTGESLPVSKSIEPVEVTAPIALKFNMVFSGSLITAGSCYAVITATGPATEIGLINSGVQEASAERMKTPLEESLNEFTNQLTSLIGVFCVGMWVLSIPKFNNAMFPSWMAGAIHYLKASIALGVAAIPEGLPAAITLCLSLGTKRLAKKQVIVRQLSSVETLGCTTVICTDKTGTLTTNKMTVKSLVTFATTNSTQSDKNDVKKAQQQDEEEDIEVYEGDVDDHITSSNNNKKKGNSKHKDEKKEDNVMGLQLKERGIEGVSYDPVGAIEDYLPQGQTLSVSPGLQLLSSIAVICNDARLERQITSSGGKVVGYIGEPTEAALKVLVEKLGLPYTASSSSRPANETQEQSISQCSDYWSSQFLPLATLEFNRDRKSMSVLVKKVHAVQTEQQQQQQHNTVLDKLLPNQSNTLLVKGAGEMLLSRCNRVLLEDGTIVSITSEMRTNFATQLSNLAERPLRCLALAYKPGNELPIELQSLQNESQASQSPLLTNSNHYITLENDLILVGICGIKDPARPEAAQAIETCRQAGIRVMMITGDSKETAVAIAKDVNIFQADTDIQRSAFTSKEFFTLPETEQLAILQYGNKVFCRTEPRDKQRLISMLERLQETVGMTGDGVNDAPALKQAAIGIAMGITGTEVAKGAADMIIADDNFSTIVSAIEEGRNIFTNMQSFICFLVSSNIGEILAILSGHLLGLPELLSPLHLLWVNLVTDGPPATALGFNPADPLAMQKPPRARHAPILSRWLMIRYFVTGAYVAFATVMSFVWWYAQKGVSFSTLTSYLSCPSWSEFAHSAEAPYWSTQPCNIFAGKLLQHPQTMALSVLVTIEMLKALSAISLDHSLFTVQPWKNKWLLLGTSAAFGLHVIALYVPFIASFLGLTPLTGSEWVMVMMLSLPILLVEEALKAVSRSLQATPPPPPSSSSSATTTPSNWFNKVKSWVSKGRSNKKNE